ncbi:Para-hydroxybenzoate--polyprenyltransferase, mitochondrial precursor (PHB:polyprenyltransferase) [Ophidiomyces ophidiicola]|uniref:Para-hydroxybenzoate--polyprenyltransferase, mitochondrial (PHB:polyprenyltransferase) n=1 Tax=Ophidiomyces ophidiicola TaxID=1387563 RepID=A0ACB8UN61_9EURO|nr:Para-hydroxybenzoate--polyprenyltransferase, mitochondrial precursor (PHB:polyprenyltransferase) [Ophidiomyces ophidiicola]KAI1906138.1 Para-hydroxybenzoate--polyprenyltransferase, mitochondrial precursor (PHB:polyprenyltransferase) [Ophidiomyces ophidiicola]KAI1915931.1 Para-hydroxybenzoate--polyprenyltransferase, mitochondrial precursor (PHB:polyprenyltransferase) [Ophidiomyces ophidiicola]KAI1930640.1 Para-hydroxybenzoate--polyprenyltransferase, mitochondrial precursor (PHB:polyprenyltrans
MRSLKASKACITLATPCCGRYGIQRSAQSLLSAPWLQTNHSIKPITIAFRPSTTSVTHLGPTSKPLTTKYTPPTRGLIALLPTSWIPYAELMRLDKPTGTYYLLFPCLFSTMLAAPMATPMAAPLEVASYSCLFILGSLIMRGAGCAINDLWDRNLDPHVERTKFRPIARNAITPQKALVFIGAQLLSGLAVLLQFPADCFWYATPSLLLVATYPLAKRITNYPQAVLGLTFSWGAIMGFPTLGIDLLVNDSAATAAAALYSSCVAWTVLYDTIYAHMDVKDDAAAGIKSIALKHKRNTKSILSSLAAVQVGLLTLAGIAAGSGPAFFVGSCGSASIALSVMVWRVKLDDVKNCWWWFRYGCWFTGGGVVTGLFADYLLQVFGIYRSDHHLVYCAPEN